jgi:hypothetical protein
MIRSWASFPSVPECFPVPVFIHEVAKKVTTKPFRDIRQGETFENLPLLSPRRKPGPEHFEITGFRLSPERRFAAFQEKFKALKPDVKSLDKRETLILEGHFQRTGQTLNTRSVLTARPPPSGPVE